MPDTRENNPTPRRRRRRQTTARALDRLSARTFDLAVFSLSLVAITSLAATVLGRPLDPGATSDMEPGGPGPSVDLDEE